MRTNYKDLVGQIVDGVLVVDSERVRKTSKKTGNEYKVRRLWVTADGSNMLEIGTQSWQKFSFLKRLDKITTEWVYRKNDEIETRYEIATLDNTVEKRLHDNAVLSYELTKALNESYEEEIYSFHSKEEWAILEEASKRLAQELTQKKRDEIEDWRLPIMIKRMLDNIEFGREVLNNAVAELTDIDSEFYNTVYSYDGAFRFECVDDVVADIYEKFEMYEKWRWQHGFDAEAIIYIRNEFRTEYATKIIKWVEDNFDEILERQRLAQERFDEETGYKYVFFRNMGNSDFADAFADAFGQALCDLFDIEINEYDERFAECNTVKEVKSVYRELAKQTHSDVTGGSDDEFIKVREAYERHLERVTA